MTQHKLKLVKDFLRMMQGRLDHAFNEQDKDNDKPFDTLYNNDFILSFMGKTCYLPFDATTFNNIESMLENILDEWT